MTAVHPYQLDFILCPPMPGLYFSGPDQRNTDTGRRTYLYPCKALISTSRHAKNLHNTVFAIKLHYIKWVMWLACSTCGLSFKIACTIISLAYICTHL